MTGPEDEDRGKGRHTVFKPATGVSAAGSPAAPPAPPQPPSSLPTEFVPPSNRKEAQRIQVGDILNHIYEVKRFIARGGMGEVFEGVSLSSEERVAIKVMLPALAADPNVQAMFRKEARALEKLAHPALVQYRLLAEEPQLGVLYIVTEFIDGTNLSDVIGSIRPTPEEIKALGRRLASGLRAAHALGAVHRDISPDNILLQNGQLDKPKIIDFGIAKDLDPGKATIIGDGFAGKLNYVAPEQLGSFGRNVGPWSDVYSLGLVLLAVSMGHDVDMGETLADAIEYRRRVPDLSSVSDMLRPVLERMLTPDPARRLRSMDEVLTALNKPWAPAAKPGTHFRPLQRLTHLYFKPTQGAAAQKTSFFQKYRNLGLAWAGTLAILAAGFGGYEFYAHRGGHAAAAEPIDPALAKKARSAVEAIFPGTECSWLSVDNVGNADGTVKVDLSGVAGDPSVLQAGVANALGMVGIQPSTAGLEHVLTATNAECSTLDAFRRFRLPGASRLTETQASFDLKTDQDGNMSATGMFDIDIGDPGSNLVLLGIKPNGDLVPFAFSRQGFVDAAATDKDFTKTGDTTYHVKFKIREPGVSGLLLLAGSEPFDIKPFLTPPAQRNAQWLNWIAEQAAQGRWQAHMIWYRAQ